MSLISNMKATILRMGEMPWPMLTQLKTWLQRSFNGGDIDNSPSLRVAFATNENNEVVTYAPVQQVFLISQYAVSPTASEAEARRAGNEIDLLLEAEARKAGISKVLLVIPASANLPDDDNWNDFKLVRLYERLIPSAVNTYGKFGLHQPSQATQFLN